MADFKQHGGPKRFGNKASFGGKPSFPKKNWADRSSGSDRSTTLHKANCSKCGNECEVPFRPVNGKPVFCRNCFVKTGDTAAGGRAGDRFQKRDFSRPPVSSYDTGGSNAAVLKQLESMNTKLDRLIAAIESSAPKAPVVKAGLTEAIAAATSVGTPAKKTKKGYPKKATK